MQKSISNPPSDSSELSLQSIVDSHLMRLLAFRDGIMLCHAGLLRVGEADVEQYRSQMPPLPRAGEPMTFLQASRQARSWLGANSLRDLITLHIVYFEQLRQFLGLARIGREIGTDQEKQAEAKKFIEDKPADTKAGLERLDALMQGGCPRKPEFRSFETLFALFAAQASGQLQSLPAGPVVATLCLPEIKGQASRDGNLPFDVKRVVRTFAQPVNAEFDRELLYEIFFAAFVICKETAEAVAKSIDALTAAPEAPSKGALESASTN